MRPEAMTVSVRGVQGVGKSTFTALMIKELQQHEKRPVYVWIRPHKLADTEPLYRKMLGDEVTVKTRNLVPAHVKRLSGSIVVIEDAPSWLSSKSRNAMECLVSSYARADDIFTIIVTQKPRALPTAITFELDKVDGRHYYRAVEGLRATEWIEWTNSEHLGVDKIILEGVKGKALGRSGRPVQKDSKRQRAFELFEKGLSNREIAAILQTTYGTIRMYRYEWRQQQKLQQLAVNLLTPTVIGKRQILEVAIHD